MSNSEAIEFDFEKHKRDAIETYRKIKPLYEAYCNTLKTVLTKCLEMKQIKYHSIESRAKGIDHFGDKAFQVSEEDSNVPKYKNPLSEITDIAGVRIITFFPITINEVDKVISQEFEVLEKNDKNDLLEKEEKLGYQSVHYLVKFKDSRIAHPEYATYNNLVAEIQVRTILQHAWAEIEHDIEYKSVVTIPKAIKRRFMALAGLLEIADREFQSIQNENEELKIKSRKSVTTGKLNNVEITGDSLKAYLDKGYGADGRMNQFSYEFMAKTLIKIGFENLKQIDDCIKDYDDNKISKIIWGTRAGQISRLEFVLLAALGDEYIIRHPWCISGEQNCVFWKDVFTERLKSLKKAGIKTGTYKLNYISDKQ